MTESPALDEFRRQLEALKKNPKIARLLRKGQVQLDQLTREEIGDLLKDEPAYYFLIAAASLNRTTLKRAASDVTASIVTKALRKAYAVEKRLPVTASFADVVQAAVVLRRGDLDRRSKGEIEGLFRDRLAADGIPLLMSPPVRQIPGILIGKRKPDGVYPDPALGHPPAVYLEIKNVR